MKQEKNTSDEAKEEAALATKIAKQNDKFRQAGGVDFTVLGQIVMTRAVADLSPAAKAIIMKRV